MATWTPYRVFLALMMVVTGSINTLSTKWADETKVDDHGKKFNHPFVQATGMFLGELSCLVAYHIYVCCKKCKNRNEEPARQKFNPLVFLPAALLDMTATSIMYIGLNLTFASSFQMLRGAVIVFTALLSVAFLGRYIKCNMWLGMLVLSIGLALVGIADMIFNDPSTDSRDKNAIISGDLLILMAQIVTAAQMVYEEKVLSKHHVHPLQAVGWEGFWGFFILGILLIPMYYIPTSSIFSSDGKLENAPEAFKEMANSWQLMLATLGNICSIAFFNFSGISVTKEMNATTRMVLDSLRTVVIWVVSLSLKWQPFNPKSFGMQLGGFVALSIGMCIYNDIVFAPLLRKYNCLGPAQDTPEYYDDDQAIRYGRREDFEDNDDDEDEEEPDERTNLLRGNGRRVQERHTIN